MKKIEAIIRQIKLEAVQDALLALEVSGLTYSEVKGFGRQLGHTEVYRGTTVKINFRRKIKIEIVVPDAKLDTVIDAIINSARTGEVGDGKIFVTNIESAYRIRTGEKDEAAV